MTLAFFIGLLGSVHCVGMCGPLMFALPDVGSSPMKHFLQPLAYQVGRVLTYTTLGLILGCLGATPLMQDWQQPLSILTGCFLLLLAAHHLLGRQIPALAKQQQKLLAPLLKSMGKWLQKPGGHFMVGLLNGLLPCGMVYLALASSLNTGSAIQGASFMFFFGLGTWPLTLGATYLGSFFKHRLRLNYTRWLPALLLVFGIWFILRGANLDIPYLSPALQASGKDILCH